jgi:uncharacterized protein (DUF983 family)
MNPPSAAKKSQFKIASVLRALCPACHHGKVMRGMSIRPKCPKCGLNFYPEPGFYLGAMVVGFFMTAVLTVPPVIVLKFLGVDMGVLIAFPFIEFIFVGTFLLFYCRIIWLHLEYRISSRLNNAQH